jgi:hypothetical protein
MYQPFYNFGVYAVNPEFYFFINCLHETILLNSSFFFNIALHESNY